MTSRLWMAAIAFLAGAIPFSVIIGRLIFKRDVRGEGSGNPGATNVLRAFGWLAGFGVLFLDMAKAGIPASWFPALRDNILGSQGWMHAAHFYGSIAILGHIFSPFLKFRGGKGVACFAGVMVAAWPLGALLAALIFVLTVVITRYVSLGSIIMVIFYLFGAVLQAGPGFAWAMLLLAGCMVIYKHRANITRLRLGEESKFAFGKAY